MTRFPAQFVNHGGGPLPLTGRQPAIAEQLQQASKNWLPDKPSSIVVISAHWESDPIRITSNKNPSMLFDYYGFPPATYEYEYPAPGSLELAARISKLLSSADIENKLDEERGYDHGVFIPLMLMYPEADIPVVCVSLSKKLDPALHLKLGRALAPLRNDGILILGSGYTFHNMSAFMSPSAATVQGAHDFNEWLKSTVLGPSVLRDLKQWKKAPGATIAHPREEHLIPLFVVAGAADGDNAKITFDTGSPNVCTEQSEHAVTSFIFESP